MSQRTGVFSGTRAPYVPSVSATRGVYRSTYTRPPVRYSYRTARPAIAQPVVPAGRGPGGAGLAAAILGPIGGLTGCLCCLNTLAIWGLFITAIPLAVFLSRWLSDFETRNGLNGAEELVAPHMLLLIVLVCSFLFTFMRRP